MGERLDDYEFPKRGQNTRRYPWADWTNGSPWRVRRGEDFSGTIDQFRATLVKRATKQGLKVTATKEDEDTLVFRFFKPDP